MPVVTLARHAMATRFEFVLHGENPVSLRAAGEEALEEIDQLESRLSLYRPSSEVAHLNARAAFEPVHVTPALFSLLEQAKEFSEASHGAFDITIAPLVRCWGFMDGKGRKPKPEELAEARAVVGAELVQLNAKDLSVRFARPGVMLDLGAIGKGYAIERAAELLREAGVTSALLHGGTSTVYGLGRNPEGKPWQVSVGHPKVGQQQGKSATELHLAVVPLEDESLSVSAVWGRSFEEEGQSFGHVIDPRTGQPVIGTCLAALALPSATETDALSTALLTLGTEGRELIERLRPHARTLLAVDSTKGLEFHTKGIELFCPV
jgi:thiamine biosynthesis lipoprotein